MKNLYATMTAIKGKEKELANLLNELAIQVRNEPGNVRFEPYTLESNPLEFHVEETYKDEIAFQAHLSTQHCKEFNKKIINLVKDGASKVVILKVLN